MEVNVHQAKTHLSKLIAAAESGEEVIIARAGKPVVKLTVISEPKKRTRGELRGAGAGKFWLSHEAFTPAADAEVQQMFDDESERPTGLL